MHIDVLCSVVELQVQPNGFFGSVSSGDIFRLSAGESDGGLLLRAPAHCGAGHLEHVTRCGLAIIDVAGPIGISIAEEG